MKRDVPFDHIIKAKAERVAVQGDWDRQRATSRAITERFDSGHDAVLLADEVGMGKTYVALAVMADFLMQSQRNDRKVLLITPPSHVLKHKWIEEIRSFSGKYVNRDSAGDERKAMRPLNIGSYWELFKNLHDYEDTERLRVDEGILHPFLYTLFSWAKSRGLLGKQPRLWPVVSEFDAFESANLRFTAVYSQAAIREFLDAVHAARKDWFRQQFDALKEGDYQAWRLANLFKEFTGQQDRFEPNVYVINMSVLSAPRSDEAENKLFSQFVLGFLLSGMHAQNRMKIVQALEGANILRLRQRYGRWEDYMENVLRTSREDMYGLREVTQRVLQRSDVIDEWKSLRGQLLGDGSGPARAFFNRLRDLVFQEKLADANIGLAVVDEVHNWKNGKQNAEMFKSQYAPAIRRKLIMTATPFQVEEGEMERVFRSVANPDNRSVEVLNRVFAKDAGLMRKCLHASDKFALAWQALSMEAGSGELIAELEAQGGDEIRATALGIVRDANAKEAIVRFAETLLAYRVTIEQLQHTLREIVIRHTKPRNKRDFRIGDHFHGGHPDGRPRPALYPSAGYASEDAAMVNFIGMRLGQLIERETGKTGKANARLLGGMSSGTRAFLEGASGRTMKAPQQRYQDLFAAVLDNAVHPKVEATVARAFDNFVQGRKTLIFCERVHTLDEIEDELTKRIEAYHRTLQTGSDVLQRTSLLKRPDQVDNLWWRSLGDAAGEQDAFTRDLERQGEAAARFVSDTLAAAGVKANARRIIRLIDVYLLTWTASENRKLAGRWPHAIAMFVKLHDALTQVDTDAKASALRDYVNGSGHIDDDRDDEATEQDDGDGTGEAMRVLNMQYRERQNLWCAEPRKDFHGALWDLLDSEAARLLGTNQEGLQPQAFADIVSQLMTGLRRVALRADLIARYEALVEYKTHFERISAGLATMDVGHGETMLVRTQRFIEGLVAEEGSINSADQRDSKRKSMWSGILRREVRHVSTMSGQIGNELRVKLCASFNSPLLPDILVCSAIGSEGIDLHRHCANIIHHDLPWNPAKLEQRIGRLDRVNSLADPDRDIRIHIGIPFLANNYEKYQYDVVFSRAQKFEVLLGTPDFDASDIDEEVYQDGALSGTIRESDDAAESQGAGVMAALPETLVQFLKIDLTVAKQGLPIAA